MCIFLQTTVNQEFSAVLNNMLDSSSSQVANSFTGIFDTIQTYSYGLAAAGLVVGMLIPILSFMFTGNFPYDTLFKYLLMAGLFVNFPVLIRLADDVFKQPADQIEKTLAVQTDNGNKLIDVYVNAYTDAVDKQYQEQMAQAGTWDIGDKLSYVVEKAFSKAKIYIWLFIAMILNLFLDVVMFLMKFASIFGAELLIALSPLSFGISFFRGFEGSIVGVLKFIFVFRLWGAVASAIKFAAYNVGFFEVVYKFHAQVDAGSLPASPDWSPLVLQAVFIVIMFMTPMFADALVSGSQAGAFFNAALAKSVSMVNSVMKGSQSVKNAIAGANNNKAPGSNDYATAAKGLPAGVGQASASKKNVPTSGQRPNNKTP